MAAEESLPVAARLAGASLLLTGTSGFLGKAVLATWLRVVADPGPMLVLLRAADDAGAESRLREQILASDAFDELDRDRIDELLGEGRLRARAADLAAPDLGGLDPADLAGTEILIHCAATVSFEEPLDQVIDLNVHGIGRLLDALHGAGADPHLVHVSTAYAAGQRTGLVLERPYGSATGEPDVDVEAEYDAAREWRRELESLSRQPAHQQRLVEEARQELGPAGALRVGVQAERGRAAWVEAQLVERSRERARALGWSDAYTFSKALAERAVVDRGLSKLTIVRPSIIESALEHPRPGWLEGIKVADPVILAYGRGLVPRFLGELGLRLDIIPVDLVAHACVAAAAHPPDGPLRCFAVASGARNPVRISAIAEVVTDHFRADPIPDEDGVPVEVPEWRFHSPSRVFSALDRGDRALAAGRRLLDRVPVPRADEAERRLHRERRQLERLRRLAEIYRPYLELDCVFDDREALALADELSDGDRALLPFDSAAFDWVDYLGEIHLPALRRLVDRPVAPRRIARGPRDPAPAEGPPAVAFFDVEGVVLDATIAHAYAWLRGRSMPRTDRVVWLAGLAARAPGWSLLDRGSRAAFNRRFYREYAELPAVELRAQAQEALSEFLLPRVRHAAVRRIRAHRARGDHVVLLTGALDFLVAPLAHLADDLVAARMEERGGAFTGILAEPPLTADGRASTAASIAADHGVDLGDCHAYGDGISDLPLLEAVGHAHAVNPDFRLAREARRRRWAILEWPTEPGAGGVPLAAGRA